MQVIIPEGDGESGVVTLTIQRAKGTAGEVAIYWEVSQDGQLDLVPYNGTVIFPDVSQPPPNGKIALGQQTVGRPPSSHLAVHTSIKTSSFGC